MNIGANNSYRPYNNSRISFGHNQGVINAIEKLQKFSDPSTIRELQAQLQDVKFTPEFVQKVNGYSDHWKKVLVKYASPKEIQDGFKKIFDMK